MIPVFAATCGGICVGLALSYPLLHSPVSRSSIEQEEKEEKREEEVVSSEEKIERSLGWKCEMPPRSQILCLFDTETTIPGFLLFVFFVFFVFFVCFFCLFFLFVFFWFLIFFFLDLSPSLLIFI